MTPDSHSQERDEQIAELPILGWLSANSYGGYVFVEGPTPPPSDADTWAPVYSAGTVRSQASEHKREMESIRTAIEDQDELEALAIIRAALKGSSQ